MDLVTWAGAAAAGLAAGAAAGLIPGFHTNTLAALVLALAPALGDWGAVAILAAAASHAYTSILPSTYVGVPGEDATLSVLPAHRLLLEGQGAQAVRIAADASLWAMVLGIPFLLPLKWTLMEPGRVLALLDAGVPWILTGILGLLLWQERFRGGPGVAKGLLVLALAGAIGMVSSGLRLTAFVPIPATPLMPLLSGLFGAAGLIHSLTSMGRPPPQDAPAQVPRVIRRGIASASARAVAAAGWTAAVPGLTSAVGASVALAGTSERDPRPALAAMSAVGAAHQVFAVGMLWTALRPRTGTAIAVQDLGHVQVWASGTPPHGMVVALATILAAAVAARWATLRLDPWARRRLAAADARWPTWASLAVLTLLVAVLSGPLGLVLYASAATVGLLPLALGVRRIHLTGCLIVPVLLARLTA